ncbi:MAG: hypothetical protein SVX43_03635 [Cyanobacteriota bacterium]|nr:hypothetical protein [Cyanobacteriota bacterium]
MVYLVKFVENLNRNLGDTIYDSVRLVAHHLSPQSKIINQKEIRVIGIKRSGNHAIINWIAKQQTGEVKHLNNLLPGRNPYRFLYKHYPTEYFRQEACGNFSQKDCLIYSYENCKLPKVVTRGVEWKHDLYLGKSKERYDVLILRDPFNMIASAFHNHAKQIKKHNKIVHSYFKEKGTMEDLDIVELWLSYAREYLGETQYLNQKKVPVNYNAWVLDANYRKDIAEQLKLEFSDRGLEDVREQGGGSSFEGRNLHGQATKMDVLNRWKIVADDPDYRRLLDNPALFEYSERIFGRIPGTEELRIK